MGIQVKKKLIVYQVKLTPFAVLPPEVLSFLVDLSSATECACAREIQKL